MHKKISRELNLHKTAVLTILSNALQILAALGALALSLATHGQAFTGRVETMLMAAIALVVSWGAILDIREATKARQVGQEADSLEEALSMLEPMITVIMGALVGFIVIAIYFPMFTMYGGIA